MLWGSYHLLQDIQTHSVCMSMVELVFYQTPLCVTVLRLRCSIPKVFWNSTINQVVKVYKEGCGDPNSECGVE